MQRTRPRHEQRLRAWTALDVRALLESEARTCGLVKGPESGLDAGPTDA